jgi:hypothetical protein
MISLAFNFENEIINATVNLNVINNDCKEYEVIIILEKIQKEFGNPIYFKEEKNFFGYKESSKETKGIRAISFLYAFKQALDWASKKQSLF